MPTDPLRKQFLTLPKTLENIRCVGAEIEGGSQYRLSSVFEELYHMAENFEVGTDGSISGFQWTYEVRFHDYNISKLLKVAEKVFNILKQNRSCGNHFHFSFVNTAAAAEFFNLYPHLRLAELYERFFGKRKKYMDRFNCGWCDVPKNTNDLMRNIRHNRYYAINLQALKKHKTVEIRLMPFASSFAEWKKQLAFTINFVEDTLQHSDEYAEKYSDAEEKYQLILEEYECEYERGKKNVP